MQTYEVTCGFDGYYWGEPADAIERSFTTLRDLQRRGIEIEHLGWTITLDADGSVSEAVARHAAPTEGHVGLLTVEARLPVSGIRRVERQESDGDDEIAIPA